MKAYGSEITMLAGRWRFPWAAACAGSRSRAPWRKSPRISWIFPCPSIFCSWCTPPVFPPLFGAGPRRLGNFAPPAISSRRRPRRPSGNRTPWVPPAWSDARSSTRAGSAVFSWWRCLNFWRSSTAWPRWSHARGGGRSGRPRWSGAARPWGASGSCGKMRSWIAAPPPRGTPRPSRTRSWNPCSPRDWAGPRATARAPSWSKTDRGSYSNLPFWGRGCCRDSRWACSPAGFRWTRASTQGKRWSRPAGSSAKKYYIDFRWPPQLITKLTIPPRPSPRPHAHPHTLKTHSRPLVIFELLKEAIPRPSSPKGKTLLCQKST